MIKILRKNNKKLLAIFGVLLMVVFILPSAVKNAGGRDYVQGRLSGKKIMASEAMQARNEWELLKNVAAFQPVETMVGVQYTWAPVVYVLGPVAMQQIEEHFPMYLLLAREAEQRGAVVSPEQVEQAMANLRLPNGKELSSNPETADRVRAALPRLLMVRNAFADAANTVKVTRPYETHALAHLQMIRLKLVAFSAEQFADQVPAPTDQQIQEQFTKYRDVDPQAADNAFGFGYRYPNRVKLQYLAVHRDQVQQVVEASRSEHQWQVDEYRYYLTHKENFAATQPATEQGAELSLQSGPRATTAPTTLPTRPFQEVRAEIHARIVKPEVDRLADSIQARINSTLASDYAAYAAAGTTKPTAGVGVSYDSPEYLPRVAQEIQRSFKVLPTVVSLQDSFKSEQELSQIGGLGQAQTNGVPLPRFATNMIKPFIAESDRENSNVLALMEPSRPMRDVVGDVYFFRVTAAQPAHAPQTVDEVLPQVRQDVIRAAAMKLASEAAAKLSSAAREQGLEAAADSAGLPLTQTGYFSDRPGASIEGFPVVGPSNPLFVQEAFTLLTEAAQPDARRTVKLIELPRDGKAVVAQLDDVKALWNQQTRWMAQVQVQGQLVGQLTRLFEVDWYDYEALKARLGYTPEHPETPRTQRASAE